MPHPKGVKLDKVHASQGNNADVDIIAIHGLDTDSRKTWTWVPRNGGPKVNWLSATSMLPSRVGDADIWTCDWQADLLLSTGQGPKSFEELARDLKAALESHARRSSATTGSPPRPILFIASCFGGLLLLKALVLSRNDRGSTLLRALSGIIFLATPFQGTSFGRVAKWVSPLLQSWGAMRNREWTGLIKLVEDAKPGIDDLVRDFTSLWTTRLSTCQVFTFYEGRNSNLLRLVKLKFMGTEEPVSYRNPQRRSCVLTGLRSSINYLEHYR